MLPHGSACPRQASLSRPADSRPDTLTADARRLRALSRELQQAVGPKREKAQADLAALLAASRTAVAERRSRLPKPEFQPDLPVNERRADIAELIAKNQVVIVCGETGSGKTTQLPKICLDLGLGARGLIGHTQPRRLAARSVATRLAQELKTQVGAGVGYKIRFHDKLTADSWVKLMTDGILLAESQSDPWLNAYDTIIIDEAHERSLNIDFLLGYLKQLLPRRPDLKLIITSATIDAERFSQHFNGAPVIEVSGRLYPVEVRYRPVADLDKKDDERDLYDAHRRCRRRTGAAGQRRHPGLPARRARNPRGGGGAAQARAGAAGAVVGACAGNPAAVLAPVGRRAGPHLQAFPRPAAHRAGDQRRRDLAHRAGHPLRDRHRAGAGQALFVPQQGRAVAGREDFAGGGAAARRALRPGGGRRLRAPVRRGGFQRPAAVHRPGNPAFVAGRRHPAHEVAEADRCRELPLHRAAAGQGDQRRLRAAAGTRRARRRQRA